MIPFVLAIVAPCYMVDPMTNYCITGESPHLITLPAPDDEKKHSAKDQHIDLEAELNKLKPTDPVCKPPYLVPCP